MAVFVNSKKNADQLTRSLRMAAWPSLMFDTAANPSEREWVCSEFRSNKAPVMVVTDDAVRDGVEPGNARLALSPRVYASLTRRSPLGRVSTQQHKLFSAIACCV